MKVSLLTKARGEFCRWMASFMAPNSLQVAFLRMSGAEIGKDVYIGKGFLHIQDPGEPNCLFIEERVKVAYRVTIITESSPVTRKGQSGLMDYGVRVHGPVRIMHDCWIGTGVIILPNVTVHEFSIIEAGAVVTKDVPAFSVAAGVPARVIKKLEKKP